MAEKKKILLSGIQPSGKLHIGNYFGALRQFVELQNSGTHDIYISVVNYHALTSVNSRETLVENTTNTIIDHLALGIKPENIFLQSDIPEVAELAWIFNTLITVPYLSRAVAYKEKIEKGLEATVGLFEYPVLMAADILIMDADTVPVGQDQKQHVEIACDLAEKFNSRYGETFTLPEEYILKDVAVVPGIDGQKMSKSYKNTIPLFASDAEIEKLVMSIVTDSGVSREAKLGDSMASYPNPLNLYAIHRLFRNDDELGPLYDKNQDNYKGLKEILIQDMSAFIAPFREKREKIEAGETPLLLIKKGRARAQKRAQAKIKDIRRAVGIDF